MSYVYSGGYSNLINTYYWNEEKLNLEFKGEMQCKRPAFLSFHPKLDVLYSASECDEGVAISAFTIKKDGLLEALNTAESSGGIGMCHLIASDLAVYGANYGSGEVVAFALDSSGKIGKELNFIKVEGSSINKSRQESAHAHQVVLDLDNKWLICLDLGTDKITSYKINDDGSLDENTTKVTAIDAGEGPRHMVFSADGKKAYVITELLNKVFFYSYEDGQFTYEDKVVLPCFDKDDYAAEIDILPNTDYIYASVRGCDKMYVIDSKTAEIANEFNCGGVNPRMFSFSTDGKFMFVSNQISGNIAVFKIDDSGVNATKVSEVEGLVNPAYIRMK